MLNLQLDPSTKSYLVVKIENLKLKSMNDKFSLLNYQAIANFNQVSEWVDE